MTSYTPAFLKAVKTTLQHEGGFVNDPSDPGGATNFGVSLRFALAITGTDGSAFDFDFDHDGDVDKDDIKLMSPSDAIEVYWKFWWQKFHYDRLPEVVAAKVFDLSVNMGAKQAHKLLQRAINDLQGNARVTVDGILGPQTFAAIDTIVDPYSLLNAFIVQGEKFYRNLVVARPALAKYRNGWLRRVYA